jgi:hypothetical protein
VSFDYLANLRKLKITFLSDGRVIEEKGVLINEKPNQEVREKKNGFEPLVYTLWNPRRLNHIGLHGPLQGQLYFFYYFYGLLVIVDSKCSIVCCSESCHLQGYSAVHLLVRLFLARQILYPENFVSCRLSA